MLREGSQVRAAFPAKTQMDFKPTVEARGKERRGSKKGVEDGENSVCYVVMTGGGGEFLQLELDTLVSSFIEQLLREASFNYHNLINFIWKINPLTRSSPEEVLHGDILIVHDGVLFQKG